MEESTKEKIQRTVAIIVALFLMFVPPLLIGVALVKYIFFG